ncbi:uncharacterized protein LOC131070291 [Cryptomeria japonica]|uniref:uncharacterized protein LOC131070291 n=1 Tax=Cryptomeria japonica TaxID=3369 RepID=UPI0025ACEF3F|nr:uncharacterized protein LOC131070291 [Cryptomeria japonica]
MNFDGASWGNPRASCTGCIIHSSIREVEAKQAKVLADDTNNVAEIHATIEGLSICKDLGFKKVEIQGDSTIIKNALRTGSTPNRRLNYFLRKVIDLLKFSDAFTINHDLREANGLANQLANRRADGFNGKYI